MHRRPLLQALSVYLTEHPKEMEPCQRIIAFVEAYPDCFERSLVTGHITGSVWLVDESGSNVMLTHHRKLGKWLQLGGHTDGNPDVLASAKREAVEESGIVGIRTLSREIFDVDIHLIPERKQDAAHFHYDCRYLMQCEDSR